MNLWKKVYIDKSTSLVDKHPNRFERRQPTRLLTKKRHFLIFVIVSSIIRAPSYTENKGFYRVVVYFQNEFLSIRPQDRIVVKFVCEIKISGPVKLHNIIMY